MAKQPHKEAETTNRRPRTEERQRVAKPPQREGQRRPPKGSELGRESTPPRTSGRPWSGGEKRGLYHHATGARGRAKRNGTETKGKTPPRPTTAGASDPTEEQSRSPATPPTERRGTKPRATAETDAPEELGATTEARETTRPSRATTAHRRGSEDDREPRPAETDAPTKDESRPKEAPPRRTGREPPDLDRGRQSRAEEHQTVRPADTSHGEGSQMPRPTARRRSWYCVRGKKPPRPHRSEIKGLERICLIGCDFIFPPVNLCVVGLSRKPLFHFGKMTFINPFKIKTY